jgi:hypothetical protein
MVLFSWNETNGFTYIDDGINGKSFLALILTPMIFLTAFMAFFAQVIQPKLIVLDFITQTVTVDNKPRRFKDVKLFEVSKRDKNHFYRLNYNID